MLGVSIKRTSTISNMYILLTFCPTKHIRIQPTIRTVQSLGNTWDQKETQATNTTIALLYKGITNATIL